MRRSPALLLLLLLVACLVAPASGAARTASEKKGALDRLAKLRTATALSLKGYSPRLYPHWLDPDRNGCDAREDTLIRDGTNVKRGPQCAIRSGIWVDQYSGRTYRAPRSLAADHLVPLANAWRSGARRWTRARRTQYANDPLVLVVTSTQLDRQKGNRSPGQWKPPSRGNWFAYAERWIRIKSKYHLAVTRSERAALQVMLNAEPANSVVPLIAGTTVVGSTLTATSGSWTGSPVPT
ncbi:MAG: hypothetical protein QOH61_1559, partial [Chloroflexota bacterium]|nr:hypothetical protein [Chloroflexota bacterium]